MPILYAASPIEIEAKADALQLPGAARASAQALLHDLTSRQKLTALTLPAGQDGRQGGTTWPAHCLIFGELTEMARCLALLRAQPDVAELEGDGLPEGVAPGTLFLRGSVPGAVGVLVACDGADRLADMLVNLRANLPISGTRITNIIKTLSYN